MARKAKTTPVNVTVADAVSTAFCQIEELKDEIQSWYDNLPENFQNGDKGSQLQEAIDALESTSEPDVPDSASDIEVSFSEATGRLSRARRRDNACAAIEAAEQAVRDRIQELSDLVYNEDGKLVIDGRVMERSDEDAANEEPHDYPYTEDERDSAITDLEAFADELENARVEWESVEFPGMYG